MKTKLSMLAYILVYGLLLGAAVAPSRIRWTWHDMTLFGGTFYNGTNLMDSVQFGLRDDGIVVWREITTATNVIVTTTNSPAERQEIPYGTLILTNMSITNLIYDDLIPRWYLSPTGIVYRP